MTSESPELCGMTPEEMAETLIPLLIKSPPLTLRAAFHHLLHERGIEACQHLAAFTVTNIPRFERVVKETLACAESAEQHRQAHGQWQPHVQKVRQPH